MAVTQELLEKIKQYESSGYGADEIVAGLAESQNFPDIAEKVKGYSTQGYGASEILDGIKSSPIAQPTPQAAVPEWGQKYPNVYGAAGAAYEALGPLLEPAGAIGGGLAGAAAGPAGTVGGAALGYAGAKNIRESAANLLGVEPPKTAIQQLTEIPEELATGAAAEMGGQVAGVALKSMTKPATNLLGKVIEKGISKGIRPSIPEVGKTSTQRSSYYKRAADAVQTIIANKPNLSYVDEVGNEVRGQLPRNLNEFSDAIGQTKKSLFSQYDAIAKTAGNQGAVVNLKPITDELFDVTQNKVLNDLNPEVIGYAQARIKALTARGKYTTTEAQDAITALNSSLQSFYKNPSYDTASKAYIDSMIANNLRKSLDNVIENTTGAGYQSLKNSYGALKAIEKDVTKRAIVDARKNVKGLIDFSDIASGATAVNGLLNMNPSTMAASATAKGISEYFKRLNDPNKIVQNMFSQSEKIMSRYGKPESQGMKNALELSTKYVLSKEKDDKLKESIGAQTNFMR